MALVEPGMSEEAGKLLRVSLSTMWAKGRFSHMAEFVAKALELGFTHIEANSTISPKMLNELLETGAPISSIHSPCPAVTSPSGIPAGSLSLSSLDDSERTEAVSFAKRTIDLAASIGASAVVVHMGEVPIDLGIQDKLYRLHETGFVHTKEYSQTKEELVRQRAGRASRCLEAAKKSLLELTEYGRQRGVMLGLETRFHPNEIPNMDEMAELLNQTPKSVVGYWHDVGHAEVQQRLGFSLHEEWLSRFTERMIGIHLHDIRGLSDHHVPGRGNMNWHLVAKYLPPGIIKACEIGEWNGEEQIRGVIKFLQDRGILNQPEQRK